MKHCTTSPKKPLHLKKLSSSQWWYSFSKILVFARIVVLIDNRHYQLISLKWQACFIHFWENVCQIPKSEYLWFDQYPFNQLKTIAHGKKAANSACNSITHVPFLETCSVFSRSVFSYFLFWMWELDYKETWAPKNWCFWTVVLEKILEGYLDNKMIKPVNPKGNQSWIFIGRTDAKAVSSNTLATWCKELPHWKRPWHWERLRAGGEGDGRGWDGWMASLTQ